MPAARFVRFALCAIAALTACYVPPEPETGPDTKRGPDDWLCRLPDDLDPKLASEVVVIRVLVGKDGKPRDVRVEKDPGHGMGKAVRDCAMRARYFTRDAQGNAIEAWSPPIKVRFQPP
jgi:hypothetical protein